MTDADHVCDDRCSWQLNAQRLRDLGYDFPDLTHDATPDTKRAWGQQFSRLRHRAWTDGHVRLCTRRPRREPPEDGTPPSTRIRTRSVRNVSDGRLLARLDFLRDHVRRSGEWAGQKSDFKGRVREVVSIEIELDRRALTFEPVSCRAPRGETDGALA